MDDILHLGDGLVPDIPKESIIKMRDAYSKSFHEKSAPVKNIEDPVQKKEDEEENDFPKLEVIIDGQS